ncbi:MAG TPA: lysophospholipid acyltransferase family protein [Bacteroidales bacterium]|nr:lysophospholipid acyltransferase family protein [Bacteroidales bacterium]
MRIAVTFLASCWFWFSLFFFSAVMFPLSLTIWFFTLPFDRNKKAVHWYTCVWSCVILGVNPYWKVRLRGKEKIDRKATYVILSNHASGADILVLFRFFIRFKWVAKQELFRVPIIGWNMSLNRYISIKRQKGRSRLAMMDKAAEEIRKGNSVMIFPEGTRTRDGNLQPFKSGAFRLALETRSPILPIAIKGTFHTIRKGGFLIHRNHNIEAVVLDAIPYEAFGALEPDQAALMVHDLINKELK